jgi:hypothetical protein
MISQEASQFWQFPGSDLGLGLRRIADDKTCLYMSDCISEGGVAEIYVEVLRSDGAQQGRVQGGANQTRRDIEKVREFYSSPNRGREITDGHFTILLLMMKKKKLMMKMVLKKKKKQRESQVFMERLPLVHFCLQAQ